MYWMSPLWLIWSGLDWLMDYILIDWLLIIELFIDLLTLHWSIDWFLEIEYPNQSLLL